MELQQKRISNSTISRILCLSLLLLSALYTQTAYAAPVFATGEYSFKESDGRVRINISNDGANDTELKMHFRITGTGKYPATYKVDFNPIDGDDNILIRPGGTSASVSFDIVDDSEDEQDETFNVELWSGYVGEPKSIKYGTTSVTIFDNDTTSKGVIRATNEQITVNEGEQARVGFERVQGSSGNLGYKYLLEPGSADADIDFSTTSGTLSWADGESGTKYVTVNTIADTIAEQDEEFYVYLDVPRNPTQAIYTMPNTKVIIKNVSIRPGFIDFGSSDVSVREDAGQATITIRRTEGSDGTVSVDYRTQEPSGSADGGATAGKDFETTEGTLTWDDGDSSSKTIEVPIIRDTLKEQNEFFNIVLSNIKGGASLYSQNSARVSIEDSTNFGSLQFRSTSAKFSEDAESVSIDVERIGGSDGAVSVDYIVGDDNDTATSNLDYKASNGTLRWADGDSATKQIPLELLRDELQEDEETLSLILQNPTGDATLGNNIRTQITLSDSTSFGNIAFASDAEKVREDAGSIVINVTRAGGSDGAVSVRVRSGGEGDTATVGNDYTALDEVIQWANGETGEKSVTLNISEDDELDEDEFLTLSLTEVGGGALLSSPTSMRVEIENTTLPKFGGLGFQTPGTTLTEGAGLRQFSVQREGGSDGVVTVQYQIGISSDSADEGTDYSVSARSGELRWEDKDSTAKTIDITILADPTLEEDETLTISLLDPAGGASLGQNAVHTITIQDRLPDDFTPVLGIVSGDQQSGFPGTVLQPFVLSVKDGETPAPGTTVNWTIEPADAGRLVDGDNTRADNDALASNTLEILKGGIITVKATVTDARNKSRAQRKISSRAAQDTATFTVNAGFEGAANLNPNQRAVGKSLDSACPALQATQDRTAQQQDLLNTCNALENASPDAIKAGIARLTPEELFAIGTSSLDTSDIQVTNVQSRINAIRLGASGLDLASLQIDLYGQQIPGYVTNTIAQQFTGGGGGAAGEGSSSQFGVFVNGSIAFGTLDESDLEMGLDFDTQGLTLGIDYRTDDNWVFGGAIGLTSHSGEFSSEGGKLELSGTSISGFATWYNDDSAYFDAILSYGQNAFDVTRRINLEGQPEQFASSKPDSNELSLSIGAGLEYQAETWQYGPYGRLGLTQAKVKSYNERASNPDAPGAGSVLSVEAQTLTSSVLVVGGQLSKTISTTSGVWIPQLRLELEHRLDDKARKIEASFLHDPSSTAFEIASEEIDTDYLNLGTGVSAVFRNGKSAYVFYETRLGQERLSQHWIKAGLRIEF